MHNLITKVYTNYRLDDMQTIACHSADGIETILNSNFCMETFKSQFSNQINYDSNDLISSLQFPCTWTAYTTFNTIFFTTTSESVTIQ